MQAVWAYLRVPDQKAVAFIEYWLCWHFSVPCSSEELERRVGFWSAAPPSKPQNARLTTLWHCESGLYETFHTKCHLAFSGLT